MRFCVPPVYSVCCVPSATHFDDVPRRICQASRDDSMIVCTFPLFATKSKQKQTCIYLSNKICASDPHAHRWMSNVECRMLNPNTHKARTSCHFNFLFGVRTQSERAKLKKKKKIPNYYVYLILSSLFLEHIQISQIVYNKLSMNMDARATRSSFSREKMRSNSLLVRGGGGCDGGA